MVPEEEAVDPEKDPMTGVGSGTVIAEIPETEREEEETTKGKIATGTSPAKIPLLRNPKMEKANKDIGDAAEKTNAIPTSNRAKENADPIVKVRVNPKAKPRTRERKPQPNKERNRESWENYSLFSEASKFTNPKATRKRK